MAPPRAPARTPLSEPQRTPWWSILIAAALAASLVLVVERVAPASPVPSSPAGDASADVRVADAAADVANVDGDVVAIGLGDGSATVAVGEASFELTTVRVGDLAPDRPVTLQEDAAAVHRWDVVDEWYREVDGEIEHGYTIGEPISGDELVVEIEVGGAQPLALDDTSAGIVLPGDSFVSYRDLVAFDADGRDLDAAMSVDDGNIVLTVDVAHAVYPVTIDPIISEDQVLRISSTGAEFGTSVAVDGDLMAVGAPNVVTPDGGGAGIDTTGVVYVYARTGAGAPWTPDGLLVNPAPSYSEFGRSVSVHGGQIAVGAPNFIVGPFADQGRVFIYEKPAVFWTLADDFGAPVGVGSYGFGYDVDFIDTDRLVIGAPGFVEGAGDQAPGQVFEYDAGAVSVVPSGATTGVGDDMGYSVAGDIRPGGGARIVVGAPGDDGDNGLMRVLDNPGAGWTNVYGLSGGIESRMGTAVDVSGDRVAYDSTNNVSVAVTGNLGFSWSIEVISSVARGSFPAPFNRHFDLEGGTLAVGAPGSNLVEVFRYDGFTWGGAVVSIGADTLVPTDAAGADGAGYAVAVDGATLAIGAPGDDGVTDATTDSGAVYAVEVPLIANFTFPSDVYGDWNDPANWDVGTVPGPDDQAIVPDNTYATVSDVRVIDRIVVDGFLRMDGRLSVSGASEVTAGGNVIVDPGGRLDLPDLLNHDGDLTITDTAQVVAVGDRSIIGAGTIDLDGEITSEGGGGTLTIGPSIGWTSGPTGSLFATDGSDIEIQGAYDATGTTAAKSGSTVILAGSLDLNATSVVELEISGPSTSTSNYGRIQVGGSLTLGAGVGSVADGTIRAVFDTYTPTTADSYPAISCAVNCNADNEHFAITDTGNLDTIWTNAAVLLEVVPNKIVSPNSGETWLGRSVDVEGNWMVAGEGAPGGTPGRAYLYENVAGSWQLRQTFTSSDDTSPGGSNGDDFGRDVAIGDNYLAISDPIIGNRALVYYRPNPATPFSVLGAAVDSDGDLDIVGDRLLAGPQSSTVYVYDLTPGGLGVPTAMAAPGGVSTSWGASLALGGDLDVGTGFVAIGDPGNLPTPGGSVWVYPQTSPTTFGTPSQLLSPNGSTTDERFGNALDASGDRLAVGEWFDPDPNPAGGSAWVFDWDPGTSSIASFVKINPLVTFASDTFGSDVAIDGGSLFVGAGAAQKVGFPFRDGAAYLFRYDGTNWVQRQQMRAADGHNQDRFGDFVALSGNNAVAGAWLDDANVSDSGAVYTFDVPMVATFIDPLPFAFWDDPTHWDTGVVPRAGDTAIVPVGTNPAVQSGETIARLIAAGPISIVPGAQLTVAGSSDGPILLAGGIDIDDDAILELGDDVRLDGTLSTAAGGTSDVSSIVLNSTAGTQAVLGSGTINNDGEVRKTGSGGFIVGVTWDDSAGSELLVDGGSLSFGSATAATAGTLDVRNGASLSFSGDLTLAPTSSLVLQVDSEGGPDAAFNVSDSFASAGELRVDNTGSAPIEAAAPYPIITCGDCLGAPNFGRFDSYSLAGLDVIPTPTSLSFDVVPNKIVSPSSPADGSQFGRAIAVQGNLAVVGAPTGLGGNIGGAYVLERDTGTGDWSIIQTLNPSPAGFAGYKVLLDGDIMIVQSSSPPDEASYIYARTGPPSAPFVLVDTVPGDHNYGSALRDGVWLVQEQDTRTVDVYDVTTSGATFVTSIPIPTTQFVFGEEIDIGGDIAGDAAFAVVASPNESKVFVFEQTGPTSWSLLEEVVSPAGVGYGFGVDIDIQGDQVVIGEPDPFGVVVPAVYVYTKTSTGLVNPVRIEPSDTTFGSQFGQNLDIEGNVLVVGASVAERDGPTSRDGAVYVFQNDGDTWQETDIVRAPDGFDGDFFGFDVALDGTRLLVGAANDANEKQVDAFSGAGAIYWYEVDAQLFPPSLTFDLDVQVGSESVEVATGISVSELDVGVTTAGSGSTLAASSLTAIAADDPATTPLTAITVGSTPLTAIALDSDVLSTIPLVNIDIDGGWEQIIAGSELENEPLASLTLGQVLAAGSPTEPDTPSGRFAATPLTAIEVDGTPLTAITLGAVALGSTPLTAIPLTAIDPSLDWCDIVAELVPPGTTCDAAFLDTLTVLEATLRGVPLTAIPLEELPLTAIDPAESPLTAIPLTAIDLFQTPLTAIPLTAIDVADLGLEAAPLTAIPLTAIPASVPLTAIGQTTVDAVASAPTAIPLTAIDPSAAPLTAIQLEGAPLTAIPLTAIVLMDSPLTAIPLTAIGDPETEWCEIIDAADIDGSCGAGIDPASTTLRELFVRGLPLTAIDFESIPLTAIDVLGLPLTAIELSDAPLTAIPVGGVPLTAIEVTVDLGSGPTSTPLTAIPLTAIDLFGTGLADAPLTAIATAGSPLTAIDVEVLPLTAIPLTAILVNGSPLTAIELTPADLADSPLTAIELSDIPLTAIDCSAVDCGSGTIADALEAGAVLPGLTLGDLAAGGSGIRLSDLVGLPNVTAADLLAAIGGLTLGDIDLDDLTLGDLPSDVLDQLTLTLVDLGAALTLIAFGDLIGNIVDPLTGEPLPGLEAELRAAIDALVDGGGAALTLGDLTSLDDVTLGDLLDGYLGAPLTLADIPTVLGFITIATLEELLGTTFDLTGLTLGVLTPEELGALTLGDLAALLTALDLGDLLEAIEDELAAYTLGDLLLALVDPGSLALGGVDFVDVELLELPEGTVPPSTFEATFELGGSKTRPLAIEFLLPPSADYLPGSGALYADTGGGPVLVDQLDPMVFGDQLALGVATVPGTAYTYEFDVLPSLKLGSTTIGASARVVGTGLTVPAVARVDVLEGAEPNDFPDTVPAMEDVIYLTYISSSTDNDVYEIQLADDDELTVQLSNLRSDFDLVLWGDPDDDSQGAPLSGTSDEAPIIPVTDPDADGADAEPLDDFVRLDEIDPDLNLIAVSNRPGDENELLSTGRLPAGTYYIQVYGSNGATNLRPAAFQLSVREAEEPPVCVAPNLPALGAAGPVPAVGVGDNALILVNESRLEQYYGAQSRQDVSDAIDRIEAHLAADPTINPVTISVDGVPSVAAAYAAWDADSCNPNAANDVVAAINDDIIDPVRDQLEHVVILGGDELIPMARLSDSTVIANEYDYRHEFDGDIAGANPDGRNSLTSAQWESTILSDEPYGDADARSLGDRFLYVTDLALGRVVESPADIVAALDTFVTYDGSLAIDTAAVLGYDFLVDGSEAAAAELAAVVPTDDELADGVTAVGQPWDRDDATSVLDAARTNALIALNAHFDHYRALPAIGDKVPGFDDNLIAADVAAELGPEALLRSLVFSAGCHSALAVSNVLVTTTSSDWAEILGQQGALFVGNTGFGYGDTEAVAYTELLMALFAEQVTGPFDLDPGAGSTSSTVGQALAWAKNEYVAGLQTLSVYDEKAVMESTFFGLPFYRVGLSTPLEPLPAPPINTPTGGELTVNVTSDNNQNVTPTGTYYSNTGADGDELTIVAPGRPIQPRQVIDVSAVDLAGDLTKLDQVAHGAIIESMSSTYVGPLDPVVASPVFDEAGGQPEPELMPGAFPARPHAITSSKGADGARQQLVLATGQYRSGPNVQRLDDNMAITVYYADPGETDFQPPRIGAVESQLFGSDLEIRLLASDGPLSGNVVDRVHVLVATDPGVAAVQWLGADLTNTGGDEWVGTVPLPPGTAGVEFIVSAKDSVGNVGVATNKASNFGELVEPPDPVGGDLAIEVIGDAGSGGWYDGPVSVQVTGSAADIEYFVDGIGPTSIASGDSFTVTGGGAHAIRVVTGAGEVKTGVVRIDDDGAPTIVINTPATGSTFVTGTAERYDVVCSDLSIDECRLRVTRTDLAGALPELVEPGDVLPIEPGDYELQVGALDSVGNTATASSTFTIEPLVGPPVITGVTGPMEPREITEAVSVEATFTDVSGIYNDYVATFDWGDGTTTDVVVTDEPSPSELGLVAASHTYTVADVYTVTVTVSDGVGGEDIEPFEFVVIFDPTTNGRVSGAGLYWSGPEAYAGDAGTWGGPALFGYRARYRDGDALPSGKTKLKLLGEFFFRSTAYDYLIVNDTMAIAEGVGTIGNGSEYRFRVQGIDNGWVDFFQISIWDDTTGEVLYDNGVLYDDGDLVLLGGIRVRS